MKHFKLLFFVTLVLSYTNAQAQYLTADEGGEVKGPEDSISEELRKEIQGTLDSNIDSLIQKGILPKIKKAEITYGWPLRNSDNFYDYGLHGISNFVDHNSGFPSSLSDYMCGSRTYDLESGYNHAGTDIYTWPFSWYKMDNDQAEVIAVASGIIISKRDGNYDRNCSFGNGSWNAVYVRHIDGSVVWYGHLKNGSLTDKKVGDEVSEGEYIGIIGSSGNSTGPHLHIEFYDPNGELIDPYKGSCNELSSSLWTNQPAYYDSKVNAIKTHLNPPEFYFSECSKTEEPNYQDAFLLGDNIKTAVYYRDQLGAQTSFYNIFRPDNTQFRTWNHNSNSDHYSSSYWYWSNTINTNEQIGVWAFEVEFLGQTYFHEFTVSDPETKPISVPLNYPQNETLIENSIPKLSWLPLADANSYHVQISNSNNFLNVAEEDSSLVLPEFNAQNVDNGTYFWRVRAKNEHGTGVWSTVWEFSKGAITSNEEVSISIPENSRLAQNYPNPFNPSTEISFEIEETSEISLKVFNLIGQEVATLKKGVFKAGMYSVSFDGSTLPSGVYLYRLETPTYSETKRMLLIK